MALIDNIVAYWKLDESSGDAIDAHASFDLTNTNTVTYSTGIINNGAYFGSSNTNKVLRISNDLGIGSGSVSISAWIYRQTGDFMFPVHIQDATTHVAYSLKYESGIKAVRNRIGTSEDQTTAQSVTINTWTHVVLTYDGTTVRCYVNNGTPQTVSSSGNGASSGTDAFAIGSGINDGTGSSEFFFNGNVDEVGVWSRALTAGEVSELYASGVGFSYPFVGELTVAPPAMTVTATMNVPTLSFVNALTVAPPAMSVTVTMNAPSQIQVGIWTNTTKNTATWSASSKNASSWTNQDKT